MAMAYINKDNPVYFSYNKADDKCSDIEESVKKICAVLDANGIYYKRNGNSDIPYCANIDEIQRETGRGALVIVIISKGYIGSLDCMHEWHRIRENSKFVELKIYRFLGTKTLQRRQKILHPQ